MKSALLIFAQMTLALLVVVANSFSAGAQFTSPTYQVQLTQAHRGFDGQSCWVHARAGAIPPRARGNDSNRPLVVMTMQKLLLSGSDVFYALNETRTADLGRTWTTPIEHESFARQVVGDHAAALPTGAAIAPELLMAGDETTVCDFVPQWHAASERILGIGHTVWYRDNRVMHVRPRGIAYAAYDARTQRWSDWDTVKLPSENKFRCAGSGSAQRVDLDNGDILVPCYFKEPYATQYSVTVCRCRFDGQILSYLEHGNEMTVAIKRGLYEPSLAKCGGRYYLTLRNDERGYVSVSDDGLHFETPREWLFDDAAELGNYNTQQHWVTHEDELYLVYTRRGANNDHVMRHRAPLFIARVDRDRLCVIRDSEQVLVPERGARLGNFGVTQVTPNEVWVTVTEWMQPRGVEKYGSENAVFVAKLKWPPRTP